MSNSNTEDPQKHTRHNNYIAFGGLVIAIATFYFTFFRDRKVEANNIEPEKSVLVDPTSSGKSETGRYPFTAFRYLQQADLASLTSWEKSIMRNEIYARHGYIFQKNREIIDYFNSQSWYTSILNKTADPQYVFEKLMNDVERFNVNYLKKYGQ